jgi:hypothetical protein
LLDRGKRIFILPLLVYSIRGGGKMNSKEKMLELIKKKQGGGRSKRMSAPKNDRKNMRKGPKIFNK